MYVCPCSMPMCYVYIKFCLHSTIGGIILFVPYLSHNNVHYASVCTHPHCLVYAVIYIHTAYYILYMVWTCHCYSPLICTFVQWNLSNVVTCRTSWYSGTCIMWSPMGPYVQWNLSNVVTYGTSCTVEPV